MTKEEMLTLYRALTAAQAYVVGFVLDGILYRAGMKDLPDEACQMTRQSTAKGGAAKLRLRLRKAMKVALVEMGIALPIGPAAMLEDPRYNKGERFEQIITEMEGGKWVKDSIPFWVAGDLQINGVEVQIKLENAEVTNEKALARASALA